MRIQRQIRAAWLFSVDRAGCHRAGLHGPVAGHHGNGHGTVCRCHGISREVGYAVGAVFDFAKALLPVALLVLLARRAFLFFVIIGFAWLGLVTYSALATHATVSTAIAAIERSGSWKMEVRSGTKAELAAVEKRLEVLSQPMPPRPSKTLAEALAVEKVPPGVWRDSRECQSIRDSKYFQLACAKVLDLRRELAAAKDYEQLDVRARELRQALAGTPLVATSDPLPEAFAATLGRLLPLDGRVGVALLLTLVIEIMSCFGLAALRALREERGRPSRGTLPVDVGDEVSPMTGKLLPEGTDNVPSNSSLAVAITELPAVCGEERELSRKPSSNVVQLSAKMRKGRGGEGASLKLIEPSAVTVVPLSGSHVAAFGADRLVTVPGASLVAADIRSAYKAWCAANGHEPLSQQKLSAELLRLGCTKWKSCGLIRYRNLQLAA